MSWALVGAAFAIGWKLPDIAVAIVVNIFENAIPKE